MRTPLRVVFVGWGAISRRTYELLAAHAVHGISVVAVGLREGALLPKALPSDVMLLTSPQMLRDSRPDLVIEAAGSKAVERWGEAALSCGCTYVVASCSALADGALLSRLTAIADRHKGQIVIPSGALAGIDALSSASSLELQQVVHKISKPPLAWKGTDAEKILCLDALERQQTFFTGSARDAARAYPLNANSVVTTALAGLGLDKTVVELVADPAATRNMHFISARGAFGSLEVAIANEPLKANPKSSEITALSIARLVENRARNLSI